MEKAQHREPSLIGSETEQALKQLQPLSSASKAFEFKTQEDAEEAWRRHQQAGQAVARLRSAGYPLRQIEQLDKMHGPGMEAAQSLLPTVSQRGALVFLIGDRGPGKTQMATWFAYQRLLRGETCGIYRNALDLWGEVRATWRSGSNQSEDEVVTRYKKAAFLVIDEAQERGDTEADRAWCDRMLTHILDARYANMLRTVLCANLNAEAYEKTIPSSVQNRVHEAGGVKVCDWPSYRL